MRKPNMQTNKPGKASGPSVIRYLSFFLNNEYYAFPISAVQEIIPVSSLPIVRVPEFPAYAKGIINIRGMIIPVIDTRLRFHIPERQYDAKTCVITIECKGSNMGFVVDTVDGVVDVLPDQIMGVPKISRERADYISSVAKIDKKIVMLIDSERIVTDEMLRQIQDNMPD